MGFSDDFKRAMKEAVYGDQTDTAWKENAEEAEAEEVLEAETAVSEQPEAPAEPLQSAPPPQPKTAEEPEFFSEMVPEYISLKETFETENATILSKGTVIRGTIDAVGAVELNGELIGDINCESALTVTGRVQGGVKAEKILLQDAVVQGDIVCNSTVNITTRTQIMGNLATREALIDGRIMGDITADGAVIAGETAVIVGDITAYTIEIRKGSYFEGRVVMTGAAGDKTKLFDKFQKTAKPSGTAD